MKKRGVEKLHDSFENSRKKIDKRNQGRLNRAAGARFELKVRNDLEKEGWIVDKWTNNVDLEHGKIVPAKPKFIFNQKTKMRIMIGKNSGFPDFIVFRNKNNDYEVIGVEVKGNGGLDKIERERAKFLLDRKIFSKIWIAKKSKKRGKIDYIDFKK